MTLADYLSSHQMTASHFAALIGCTPQAVSNYLNGRVPSCKVMQKIMAVTQGEVTANDFYQQPVLSVFKKDDR